jgi:hypothetical protein
LELKEVPDAHRLGSEIILLGDFPGFALNTAGDRELRTS